MTQPELDPSHIMQVGMGFFGSRALLTAVELGLFMLIEFGDAFDYSGADLEEWCSEAGFTRFEVIPLAGPSSAAVAYKPG